MLAIFPFPCLKVSGDSTSSSPEPLMEPFASLKAEPVTPVSVSVIPDAMTTLPFWVTPFFSAVNVVFAFTSKAPFFRTRSSSMVRPPLPAPLRVSRTPCLPIVRWSRPVDEAPVMVAALPHWALVMTIVPVLVTGWSSVRSALSLHTPTTSSVWPAEIVAVDGVVPLGGDDGRTGSRVVQGDVPGRAGRPGQQDRLGSGRGACSLVVDVAPVEDELAGTGGVHRPAGVVGEGGAGGGGRVEGGAGGDVELTSVLPRATAVGGVHVVVDRAIVGDVARDAAGAAGAGVDVDDAGRLVGERVTRGHGEGRGVAAARRAQVHRAGAGLVGVDRGHGVVGAGAVDGQRLSAGDGSVDGVATSLGDDGRTAGACVVESDAAAAARGTGQEHRLARCRAVSLVIGVGCRRRRVGRCGWFRCSPPIHRCRR